MIDPLLKPLETLRQVCPQGAAMLIAPITYNKDDQWMFILTDVAETEYNKGFAPDLTYRFFPGADENLGFAFRTGQEAIDFARVVARNFDMERFEDQLANRLSREYFAKKWEMDLVASAYPGQNMNEVLDSAIADNVVRKRAAINKMKDMGITVIEAPHLTPVKD